MQCVLWRPKLYQDKKSFRESDVIIVFAFTREKQSKEDKQRRGKKRDSIQIKTPTHPATWGGEGEKRMKTRKPGIRMCLIKD